jgi:hypothetical protein
MSRTFYITAAAAMFASVAAFAQTPADKTAPTPDSTASAPAASDSAAPADAADAKMHHHHHHAMRDAKNSKNSTDSDADKLNACMANATPTDTQESCLKQAEGS